MKPYYDADGITLYQGDNREVLPALIAAGVYRPEDVALLWGDPPYGTGGQAFHGSVNSRRGCKGWKTDAVAGDRQPFDPAPWLIYPRLVLWGAQYYASRLPDSSSWWTWDKKCQEWDCTAGDQELAWTNLGGVVRTARIPWLGGQRTLEPAVHPTQKPVALARWGFERAKLKAGDLVLSPWLGSGPEAVAARDMGLKFIGIELVPEYLHACVNRLRQRPLLVTPPTSTPSPIQDELLATNESPPSS